MKEIICSSRSIICWTWINFVERTTNTTQPTSTNVSGCYLDNLRMTCAKINFESSEHYDLKAQKQLSDGLLVGNYDYWTWKFKTLLKHKSKKQKS